MDNSASSLPHGWRIEDWRICDLLSEGDDVVEIDAHAVDLLPVCQKPTGVHKKTVHLDSANARLVKGPFARSDFERLQRILWLNALQRDVCSLGAVVPPLSIAYDRQADACYLLTPHLNPEHCATLEPDILRVAQCITFETKTNHGTVTIVPRERQGVTQLSNYDRLNDPTALFRTSGKELALLKALIVRYILGVGDTHLGNVLFVDTGSEFRLAVVDAEDVRQASTTASLSCCSPPERILFTKPPSRAVVQWLSDARERHRAELQRWCEALEPALWQITGCQTRLAIIDAHLDRAAVDLQHSASSSKTTKIHGSGGRRLRRRI